MAYEFGQYDSDPELEGINFDEFGVDEEEYAPDVEEIISAFDRRNPFREIPTTSSNTLRPRTVAAAYERNDQELLKGKLTVVFRDGTVWTYDDISPGEWANFHASISKGKDWLNVGRPFYYKNNYQNFSLDKLSPEIQGFVAQQRLAQRRGETSRKYKAGTMTVNVKRTLKGGKTKTYSYTKEVRGPRSMTTGETLRRRRAAAKANGVNPSKGGKPPKRK